MPLSLHVQWGYTPLLRAVAKGHADIARFLLASGSDFDERNSVSEHVHVYQSPMLVKTCVCVEFNTFLYVLLACVVAPD